jgi:hypothetical protein
MPRVVPSQVVTYIDQVFPWAKDQVPGTDHSHFLNHSHAGPAAGLLDLISKIPDELLTMGDGPYSEFVSAVASIKEKLLLWQNQTNFNLNTAVGPIPGFRSVGPLTLIREALIKCPDENASPGTTDLRFITDEELRQSLRNDIGAVNRALANGEWKAATVLAGSALEALLLWALQIRSPADLAAVVFRFPDLDKKIMERWDLNDYIEAALLLGIVGDETATQARLARKFRNLIHPGRAQRLAQECNRGTALSAVAGLEHVVTDLERKVVH